VITEEKTFRILCAWRSILSDTIDREIYHPESETFTGAPSIATNNRVFLHIPAYRYLFKQLKKMAEKIKIYFNPSSIFLEPPTIIILAIF